MEVQGQVLVNWSLSILKDKDFPRGQQHRELYIHVYLHLYCITRVTGFHNPSTRLVETGLYTVNAMQRVMETGHPSTRIPHPPWPLLISDVGLELEGTLINCSLL